MNPDQLVLPGFEYLVPESSKEEVGSPKLKAIRVSSRTLTQIYGIKDIQEKSGQADAYNLGLYNGMEMITAMIEERKPKFKDYARFG